MPRQREMRDLALSLIKYSWSFARDTYMEDVIGQRPGDSIARGKELEETVMDNEEWKAEKKDLENQFTLALCYTKVKSFNEIGMWIKDGKATDIT